MLRAPDLYAALTRARQKLIITGTRFGNARDNVLDVAEWLANYLGSRELADLRHETELGIASAGGAVAK